jgi:XTP/dITP diphosphohydrolase
MKQKILVATTNPGKIAELRAMLEFDVEWVGLADFPNINEVKEDGETFAENARKKAVGYAKKTGLWTIADDSGLVVDALGGQPGVRSARFAGLLPQRHQDTKGKKREERHIIDRKNIEKLLEMLKDIPRENGSTSSPSRAKPRERTARFVCCLCLARDEKVLIETEGKLEGVIAEKEMGTNGFGYDPIFFVPKLNKTVAQLTREEKNAISHRGNAIRKLKPLLGELLETT